LIDQAEAWHVIALSALSEISLGFFHPVSRAMLPVIVEQPHLCSAMALSQTGQTSMRIGGALLAGLLLSFADFTLVFGVMALLNLAAATMVALIRTQEESHEPDRHAGWSFIRQISAGARWALETRRPLAVLAISAVLFIFLQPYEGVMVPLIVIGEHGHRRSWVG
jgi:Na+-transporting methylmalonyl-CoA/oxaloacetate decarboxylase gamma subunit